MTHRAGWAGAVSGTLENTDPSGRTSYVIFLARDAFPVLD
jgi:hypothetical protein